MMKTFLFIVLLAMFFIGGVYYLFIGHPIVDLFTQPSRTLIAIGLGVFIALAASYVFSE